MDRLARGRDLRKGRHSEPGHYYLLTSVTQKRTPYFQDFALARRLIVEMQQCDALSITQTICFVVMPDHFHWLICLQKSSLAEVMQRVKSRSSAAIRVMTTTSNMIWQHGYHDHAVRADEDLKAVARYVVANPLRAGLCSSLSHYPHWDAMWLSRN